MNFDPSEIRLLIRVETRRTGRPVHDEDLEQDATLKAVEAFRKDLDIRYPHAFLRKIVCDAVRDHWRKRRNPEDLECVEERHLAQAPEFEEQLDRKRQIARLQHALAQLDPSKRLLLDLFYMQERPVAEIACLQQRSVSAVKMELLRARHALAKALRRLPVCSTPRSLARNDAPRRDLPGEPS